MALSVTPTDEMKTLTVGQKIYEIVDDQAREDVSEVRADLNENSKYDFAALSPGYQSYIEYDTVNETLTIPRDIAYYNKNVNGNNDVVGLNSNEPYVISNVNYASLGTTNLKLVLDESTLEFSLVPYFEKNGNKKLIACLRLKKGNYSGGLVTPYPWKIDGKVLGANDKQLQNQIYQLSNLANSGYETINLLGDFINGGWSGTDGSYQAYNYRVCSKNIIKIANPVRVKVQNDFRFGYLRYNNGVFITGSDSGWLTGEFTIPAWTEFKCTISKATETSQKADIDEFTSAIQIQLNQEVPPHYNYSGRKIDVKKHGIDYANYFTIQNDGNGEAVQGSAVYNNLLFSAWNKMQIISINNLLTKAHVGTINLTGSTTYHCNSINFGVEKYVSLDTFPLLYVSMENQNEHKCLVMRITENNGVYSAAKVQEIVYPAPADFAYYPNCMIDTDRNLIFVSGYSTNSYIASPTNRIKVACWNLPKLADGDTTLLLSDAIKVFELESYTCTQGGMIVNGSIIQCFGADWAGDGQIYILSIDTNNGAVETKINLNSIGIAGEPESVFVWNNELYMMDVVRKIYKFTL